MEIRCYLYLHATTCESRLPWWCVAGGQAAWRGGLAWAGDCRGSWDSRRDRHPKGIYSSRDVFILSRSQLGTFSSFLLELPEPTQPGWARDCEGAPASTLPLIPPGSLLKACCFFLHLQDPLPCLLLPCFLRYLPFFLSPTSFLTFSLLICKTGWYPLTPSSCWQGN